MMDNMRFGEKIERLSEEKGWNKAELARRAKVSKTTITNWFGHKRKPYDKTLLELADLFDVPVDFLVNDELDDPPPPELSDEEWAIIDQCRIFGLHKEDAIRGLALAYAERRRSATHQARPPDDDGKDITRQAHLSGKSDRDASRRREKGSG